MRVSFKSIAQVKPLLVCSMILAVISIPTFAAEPVESSIKPKASKSLLLDMDRHGSKIVAVGERGHVLVSSNNGESWTQSRVPTAQMLTAVDFINERLGWAVGHDGHIIHTEDGGATWVLQRDGLKAQSELNVASLHQAKEELKALKIKIAIGPSRVEVGEGVTPLQEVPVTEVDEYGYEVTPMTQEEQLEEAKWEVENAQARLDGVVVAPPLMDVWFSDENNGWAVGAFGSLVRTTDGGKTWKDQSKNIGNEDKYHLNAVTGVVNGTVIIGGEAGFAVYSQDNGVTWTKADLGYDGSIFGLTVAQDGSMIVATGLRGNTFRSLDLGVTWETIYPGIDYSLSNGSIYGDGDLVLVGTGGSISISHDKGSSFKQYTLPARASLSNVVVLDSNKFLLVGQGGIHHFEVDEKNEVNTASTK